MRVTEARMLGSRLALIKPPPPPRDFGALGKMLVGIPERNLVANTAHGVGLKKKISAFLDVENLRVRQRLTAAGGRQICKTPTPQSGAR